MFEKSSDIRAKAKLEAIMELEKEGFNKAARHLSVRLVQEYPSCKACRGYMGRLFAENENENNTDTTSFKK